MRIGAGFTPYSQKSRMDRPHKKNWMWNVWSFKTPSRYGWGIRALGCRLNISLKRKAEK